jgi:quercetin dioxygenase-like cupin family protein
MSNVTDQVFPTVVASEKQQRFAVVGTLLQFVSTPEQSHSKIAVMRGGIPAGAVIQLHSHADPEIFSSSAARWKSFKTTVSHKDGRRPGRGDVVTIAGGTRHAIRNPGSADVACVLISEDRLYLFFRELAIPVERGAAVPVPSEAVMLKLFEVAAQYDYWIGHRRKTRRLGYSLGEIAWPSPRDPQTSQGSCGSGDTQVGAPCPKPVDRNMSIQHAPW